MKETKSNWSSVTDELMQSIPEIELGQSASNSFYNTPSQLLHYMSYYKFASKMIGKDKRVLDVNCSEGLGTFLIGKECGFAKGIGLNKESILQAKKNFKEPFVAFEVGDHLKNETIDSWDAIISFDTSKSLMPEFERITKALTPEGIAIIGTSIKKTSHKRLEKEARERFDFVFMFSANGEMIHTNDPFPTDYLLTIGCKKKK